MNGILLVDKPGDWTSNDVVQKLRGILHERRIGHAGTLDPMATGLLTVFVGRATRAVEFAEADAKRYRAALRLGLATDTQDITGTGLRQEAPDMTREALEQALKGFRGEIRQIPPMYSAVKVNGERLYKLARRGETVERAARTVTIHGLDLLGREGEDWILDIRCSKGTYIRTLCDDIGRKLCCGGCMEELTRTASGQFRIGDAVTLGALRESCDAGEPERYLIPVDRVLADHPAVSSDPEGDRFLHNGNPVAVEFIHPETGEICRVYDSSGQFTGLYRKAGNYYRPEKMFL